MGICVKTSKFYLLQLTTALELRQPNRQLHRGQVINDHHNPNPHHHPDLPQKAVPHPPPHLHALPQPAHLLPRAAHAPHPLRPHLNNLPLPLHILPPLPINLFDPFGPLVNALDAGPAAAFGLAAGACYF